MYPRLVDRQLIYDKFCTGKPLNPFKPLKLLNPIFHTLNWLSTIVHSILLININLKPNCQLCYFPQSTSPAFRSTWPVWTSAGCGPLTSSSPSGPVAFRRSASVQRRTAQSASDRSGPAFPEEICEQTSCGKDCNPNNYSRQEISLKQSHLALYVRD